MALDANLVGTRVGPLEANVDARWTMAYAASLGDSQEHYFDTRRAAGIVAHPLFPVCFEWPAAAAIRMKQRAAMQPDEAARAVHATHHTIIHRPLRPPIRPQTTAEVVGIERRTPGAYEVVRFETVDEQGAPVCTTYYGTIYRDVAVNGADRPARIAAPPAPTGDSQRPRAELPVTVGASAAHLYTECARIWNPIHTDRAVAARAGLPSLILHGTATLALAVSAIVKQEAGDNPERVAEVYGRFAAMVPMPSTLLVRVKSRDRIDRGAAIFFEVLNADGGRAIRDGLVVLNG